jgi:hypothetical protein
MYETIINSFSDVLTRGFSKFELLLNISFILIIGLIIFIFYWHNINRQIAKLNRCKINLNSEGSIYNLYTYHDQTKLFRIRYDNTTKHNVSIDCSCPPGNVPNKFNIPIYNNDTKSIEKYNKYCVCDKSYDLSEKNKVHVEGDEFLTNYYQHYDYRIEDFKNTHKFDTLEFPKP